MLETQEKPIRAGWAFLASMGPESWKHGHTGEKIAGGCVPDMATAAAGQLAVQIRLKQSTVRRITHEQLQHKQEPHPDPGQLHRRICERTRIMQRAPVHLSRPQEDLRQHRRASGRQDRPARSLPLRKVNAPDGDTIGGPRVDKEGMRML